MSPRMTVGSNDMCPWPTRVTQRRPWERIANEHQGHRSGRTPHRRSRRHRCPPVRARPAKLGLDDHLSDIDGHDDDRAADRRPPAATSSPPRSTTWRSARRRRRRRGPRRRRPRATDATSSNASASSSSASASGTGTSVTVTWPVTEVKVQVGDLVKAGRRARDRGRHHRASSRSTSAEANLGRREVAEADRPQGRDVHVARDGQGPAHEREESASRAPSPRTARRSRRATSKSSARQSLSSATAQLKRDKKAHAPAATIRQDKAAITSAEQNLASAKLQVQSGNRQAANQVTSARMSVTSAPAQLQDRDLVRRPTPPSSTDDVAIAKAEQALARRQGRARSGHDHRADRRPRHRGQRRRWRGQHRDRDRAPVQPARADRERHRGRHPVPGGRPAGDRRDQRDGRHGHRHGDLDRPRRLDVRLVASSRTRSSSPSTTRRPRRPPRETDHDGRRHGDRRDRRDRGDHRRGQPGPVRRHDHRCPARHVRRDHDRHRGGRQRDRRPGDRRSPAPGTTTPCASWPRTAPWRRAASRWAW